MAKLERSARSRWRLVWIPAAALAAFVLLSGRWPARVVPEAPRMVARIPAAPEVVKAVPAVRRSVRHVAEHHPRRAPLTIKLQTADPNIVIYWIAD